MAENRMKGNPGTIGEFTVRLDMRMSTLPGRPALSIILNAFLAP